MSSPGRRRSRENALQVLYQAEDKDGWQAREALEAYWQNFTQSQPANGQRDFTAKLVEGVRAHLDEIDQCIRRCAQNWRLERMSKVDRNILRIATYELLFESEVPGSVVLNEAIEIAKRFGTAESAGFVNGLLDRVAKETRSG